MPKTLNFNKMQKPSLRIELAFAKDKESVIDAEFKALPSDSDGTLITYIEEDKSISAT